MGARLLNFLLHFIEECQNNIKHVSIQGQTYSTFYDERSQLYGTHPQASCKTGNEFSRQNSPQDKQTSFKMAAAPENRSTKVIF
jgi:hypothetical protein